MTLPLETPIKEVDVDFLVFIQRYATDLLKWDVLTFFAHNPDFCGSLPMIAKRLGRSAHSLQPELGDLVMLGILEQKRPLNKKTEYRLTGQPYLRHMTLKFAD